MTAASVGRAERHRLRAAVQLLGSDLREREARGRCRVELAREALVVRPACVDAALDEGVVAGERALARPALRAARAGGAEFAEDAGDYC